MDSPLRLNGMTRSQMLFGTYAIVSTAGRKPRDERVDLPAIEESARVTFSEGIAAQAGFPVRGGADRYRVLQDDAARELARRVMFDDKED